MIDGLQESNKFKEHSSGVSLSPNREERDSPYRLYYI